MPLKEKAPLSPEAPASKELLKEIERKFLVASLPPDLERYEKEAIEQGYIAIAEDGTEVRLRRKDGKYYQTVKSGGGRERSEAETELSEDQYDAFWGTTEGKRLEKTRYRIPYEGATIELDVFGGGLQGHISAEVEFASSADADAFTPPAWFGAEVTEDPRYKNQSLALRGAPAKGRKPKEADPESAVLPSYELDDGVERLGGLVDERLSDSDEPVVVEIAGGSASGKTSAVADKIRARYGDDAVIISMDDYYRGRTFMAGEAAKGRDLNWDQPEALDLDLLKYHLSELKAGRSVEKPKYDFGTGEPAGSERIDPKRVIIVEGLFALDDAVKGEGDIKAFVDIGTHGRIMRRLLRDVVRTGQKPADILNYFSGIVEPMHERYIESTKRNADMVISNEYRPSVEAERSGLHEVQLKFRTGLDPDAMRKAGAERLNSTVQTDVYYNPRDRDLRATGEALRIRREADRNILAYKGPAVESEFRKRPKFEFEIDDETERAFLGIYGDRVKTIEKERTLYQLDGLVFSIDTVAKDEGGARTELGTFLELRSTNDIDDEHLRITLAKLGLRPEDGIKEAYSEM